MLMQCTRNVVYRGDAVRAGMVLDIADAEVNTTIVQSHFRCVAPASNPPASQEQEDKKPSRSLVAGLTREQAIMKLQQAGVKVKGNVSNAELVNVYNTTFANISEV